MFMSNEILCQTHLNKALLGEAHVILLCMGEIMKLVRLCPGAELLFTFGMVINQHLHTFESSVENAGT